MRSILLFALLTVAGLPIVAGIVLGIIYMLRSTLNRLKHEPYVPPEEEIFEETQEDRETRLRYEEILKAEHKAIR